MSEKDSAMDYPEHENTYDLFIKLSTWSTIGIAVVLILMAMFLL